MDEGSDGRFRTILNKIFGKNDLDLEEHILEAKDDGEIEGDEVRMLLNVLDLDEKLVTEVMVPRIDMECAEISSTIRDIAEVIINGDAHSRIPIYKENKDNIIGMVHAKDLLEPLMADQGDASVSSILRPPFFVQESASLNTVLATFKTNGVHIGIVQDKYGGTAGLVTLDDVLEEIVGEIQDEYDADRPDEIHEYSDNRLLVSGRVTLDELDEKYNICLDSEQVDSIGGYFTALAGRVPQQGEFFNVEGRTFTIQDADAKQVRTILVRPARLEQAPAETA